MLAQIDAIIPKESKKTVAAFLATTDDADDFTPEAHGYEFQSGGVIEMLEKLKDKFTDERTDLEKQEMNARHAYDMLMQDLTAQIDNHTKQREEKAATSANKKQAASDAKGDLTDTTQTRDDDSKYLSDVSATCTQKAQDFENRQQLRADEIAALEQAN